MKSFGKYFVILLSLFCLTANNAFSRDEANRANGQWQYLIRRGDSQKAAGSLPNPKCPLYVGYFSLDIRGLRGPDRKGRNIINLRDGEVQAIKAGNSKRYIIGKNSYEVKGSYTPTDNNNFCEKPPTQIQNEKAPLYMTKISSNGQQLEWDVDFLKGNENANALWKVKATYKGGDTMSGVLKAYVCEGNERISCSLINVANFEAKRVKSIEEASRQALFKKELTPFERAISKLFPNFYDKGGLFDNNGTYKSDLNSLSQDLLKEEYIKPSLKAVLPAFSAGDIGIRICQSKGGTVSGATCKLCQNINCAPGQTPTQEEQGICYGNNDGSSVCQCDCGNCSAASLHKYTSACQSL